MAGPNGYMLFGTNDHGSLLRVLISDDEQGKTCVEYDRPSSLVGQIGDDRIAPTAAMLDRKLVAAMGWGIE